MQSPILPITNPSPFQVPALSLSSDASRLLISPQIDGHDQIETKPFLRSSLGSFDKRRRRAASATSLSPTPPSGDDDSDTHRITRLRSTTLFRYLGVGYRWVVRFLALSFYSFLIFPGLVQVAFYYFFSSRVLRGIVFGDQPRNRLDLYLPKDTSSPKPVVAFVTGGAWIIGNKAWGSLLGQQLSERDIMVACIDYRNFPQATISDMVKDSSQGISFVFNHIAEYGGDPTRIYLVGQSAGAHIAACALVDRAIEEAGEGETSSWSVSQLKAYFGLSGGYNLLNLADHFHTRGLYRSLLLSIMDGEQSLQRFSPEIVIQDPNFRYAVSLLPPIVLFHGTGDYSIPFDSSKSFAETLQRVGAQAELVLYEGRTHTDIFVQDPMRGEDKMFEDLVSYIHAGDPEAIARDAVAPPRKRLVPEFMLKLASRVSPF